MKKLIAFFLSLGLLTLVFACEKQQQQSSGSGIQNNASTTQTRTHTIEVAGSTSVTPLMELLVAEYVKTHPNIRININGTGSSDGIRAAADGTSELGMSSRALTPTEKGYALDEKIIAIDGIAVIVNPASPLNDLSIEQIRNIYSGTITDWNQISSGKSGRIAVVSREPGSGTRGAFEDLVGIKSLVLGGVEFDGTGAIKAEISRNTEAIGYISLGSVDSSVKAINVQTVAASSANVVNGIYPIARPFIVISRRNINPEAQSFLDWILSPQGQTIVGRSWIRVDN